MSTAMNMEHSGSANIQPVRVVIVRVVRVRVVIVRVVIVRAVIVRDGDCEGW